MAGAAERTSIPERAALGVLWVFTIAAITGFATFGVHPEWLGRFPSAAPVYAQAFRFFGAGQVWIAWGAVALFLSLRVGNRWLPAFAAVYVISLSSELAGTSVGLPFGAYEYTSLMEPKWFGLVPIVIPLSWFYMGLASYAIAGWVRDRAEGPGWGRVWLGAGALTAWDLTLDPAMSAATRYWAWESTGPYYGMPWLNLLGWFVTGLLLMTALRGLRVREWLDGLPRGWILAFYGANLVLPVGMNLAAGLWLAGAVGALLLATVVLALRGGESVAEVERIGETIGVAS